MENNSLNFNSYNAINQFAQSIGLNKDISGEEINNIFSNLEKDDQGNVSLTDFAKAVADNYNIDAEKISEESEYLMELFASGDGDVKSVSSEDIKNFVNSEKDVNTNVSNIILEQVAATIEQRRAENQTEKNSKTGLGKFCNWVSGCFGGGTKGADKKIDELEKLYKTALKNPSDANLQKLYQTVYGEPLDMQEIESTYQTAKNLQNGGYKTADGETITIRDIAGILSEQVNSLDESFDETVNSQGLISKGLGWLNNNLIGLGQTENMTKAQLKEYKNLAQKLTQTTDPVQFAALFKELTGEELTETALSQVLTGTSMVENSKAAESMMDYEQTQAVAVTTFSAVTTGIVTAAMGPLAGAAVGAAVNVGIHGLDSATRNNGKGFAENIADYAKNGLIKDAAVGAINGFSNVIGNKAGAAIKGLAKDGTGKLVRTGLRLVSEFIEGGSDGAISNAGEYLIDVAAGDAKFSTNELLQRTALGFGMGGVMSVGMQESMSAIGGGIAFVKGMKNGAADGIQDGMQKGAVDGVQDGMQRGTADGIQEGIEKSAADITAGTASGKLASETLSESSGLVGKLSGKNLDTLQEAINNGSIKSCKEALDAGYTMADIVSIDNKIKIFDNDFIDFSNPKEVADLFNTKISQQMKVKTPEEIDIIIDDIMKTANCSRNEAMQTLQRLTQFSSFKSGTDLAEALSKEDIRVLIDTGSGTSTNKALNYVGVNKEQFNLTGSKKGLILDNSALEFLRKADISGFDPKNGTIVMKVGNQDTIVKLLNVDGWNIGSNGSYVGYSLLGSSLDGNKGIVDTCADLINGKLSFNDGIKQEAVSIIMNKLGVDPNTVNFKIADIVNGSLQGKEITSALIADTMAPNMSNEYIQAFFEEFPPYLGAPDEAQYRKVLSEYLYDTMTFLSPESSNITMKDMYKQIQDFVIKQKGSFNPDNVFYVIQREGKSYSLVAQQFANTNGIKPSQIISNNDYLSMNLSGKTIVVIDDIVGSGDSLKAFDITRIPKNSNLIYASLSSLDEGIENLKDFIAKRGVNGEVIYGCKVDAYSKYKDNSILNKIIGSTGYCSGYAATFPQYMLPDNNTAISSLFGRMSLLKPDGIKLSGGYNPANNGSYYVKEFYGGSIINPTPDSLCGKILARMKELIKLKSTA